MANKNALNKDPFTYAEDRRRFLLDLQRFHTTRGTPFDRIPQIGGSEVDLYRLYRNVTDLGGWQKVNNDLLWEDIQEDFSVPVACTNGAQALKYIYFRYLHIYEKVHFLGLDADHSADDQEDGPARKKICLPVESIPLTYNYNQHKLQANQREASNLSTNLARFSDYEKLEMSLRSGLPNEVDFAVNVCLLLSNEGRHVLKLNKSLHLLPLLMATIGIFEEGPSTMEDVFTHSWTHSNSKRNFLRFWHDIVKDNQIRQNIKTKNGIYKHEEMVGSEVLHLERDLGVRDAEGQRVLQLAMLIRNLSFEEVNQQLLASSSLVFRFLMLCVHSSYGSLRQLALDTLGNLATQMVLQPVENTTTQLIVNLIKKSLMEQDKFVIVRALEMLSKLCQLEKNEAVLNESLEGETYSRIVQLLTVHDIQLIVHTLEALYQLSELGETTSTMIARVKKAVDLLVNLITVEAQSYGPNSLIGIKVVEYVPPVDPAAAHSAMSTPQPSRTVIQSMTPNQAPGFPVPASPHLSAAEQARADIEATATNWLQGTFETKKGSCLKQADMFADYQEFCRKFGIPDTLTSADFVTIVKSTIPQAKFAEVDKGEGHKEPVVKGLSKRAKPKPFAILAGSDKVYKPSRCSVPVNSVRGRGPAANWLLNPDPSIAPPLPPPTHTPTLRQRLMEPPQLPLQHQLLNYTGATTAGTPPSPRPTSAGGKIQPSTMSKSSPGGMKKRQTASTPLDQPSGPGPGPASLQPAGLIPLPPRPPIAASTSPHQRPVCTLQQQQLQVAGAPLPASCVLQPAAGEHVVIQPSSSPLLKAGVILPAASTSRCSSSPISISTSLASSALFSSVVSPSAVSAPSTSPGQQFPLIHQALQGDGASGLGKVNSSAVDQGNVNDTVFIKSLLAKKVCQNLVRQGNTTPSQSPPPHESHPESPPSATNDSPRAMQQDQPQLSLPAQQLVEKQPCTQSHTEQHVQQQVKEQQAEHPVATLQNQSLFPSQHQQQTVGQLPAPHQTVQPQVGQQQEQVTRLPVFQQQLQAAQVHQQQHTGQMYPVSQIQQQQGTQVHQQQVAQAQQVAQVHQQQVAQQQVTQVNHHQQQVMQVQHQQQLAQVHQQQQAAQLQRQQQVALLQQQLQTAQVHQQQQVVQMHQQVATQQQPPAAPLHITHQQQHVGQSNQQQHGFTPPTVVTPHGVHQQQSVSPSPVTQLLHQDNQLPVQLPHIQQSLTATQNQSPVAVQSQLSTPQKSHVQVTLQHQHTAQQNQSQMVQTQPQLQQVVHIGQGHQMVLHQKTGQPQQQQQRIPGQQQMLQVQRPQIVVQQQVQIRPQQQSAIQQQQQQVVLQGQPSLQQGLHQAAHQLHVQQSQGQSHQHVSSQSQPVRIQVQPQQQPMVIQLPMYQLPQMTSSPMASVSAASVPTTLVQSTAGGVPSTTAAPCHTVMSQQPVPVTVTADSSPSHRVCQGQGSGPSVVQHGITKQGSEEGNRSGVTAASCYVSVTQGVTEHTESGGAVLNTCKTPSQPTETVSSEGRTVVQPLRDSLLDQRLQPSIPAAPAVPTVLSAGQSTCKATMLSSCTSSSSSLPHPASVSSSLPVSLSYAPFSSPQSVPIPQSSSMSLTQAILSGQEVHKTGSNLPHLIRPSVESHQHTANDSGYLNGNSSVSVTTKNECNGLGEMNGGLGSPHSVCSDLPPSPKEGMKCLGYIPNGLPEGNSNSLKDSGQLSKELLHTMAEKVGKMNGVTHYIENGDLRVNTCNMVIDQESSLSQTDESVRPEKMEVDSCNKVDMWQVNGLSSHGPAKENSAAQTSLSPGRAGPMLVKQTSVEEVSLDSTDSKLVVNCSKASDSGSRPLFSPDGSHDSDVSCDSFASSLADSVSSDKHSSQGPYSFSRPSSTTAPSPSPSSSSSSVFPDVPLVLAGTIPMSEAVNKRSKKKPPARSKSEKPTPTNNKKRKGGKNSSTPESPSTSSKPPVIEYMCEWTGCRRCFDSARLVFIHVTKTHVPALPESVCQWYGCEPLRRKRWSLVTHLQDHHCSEAALRAGCQRRFQAAQTAAAASPHPPTPLQQAPALVYPPDAAMQAIKRFHIKPPFAEFADQREGPVTKHIRLTAALILRNLARYSAPARSLIRLRERQLNYVTMSACESSTALASCLWEILHGP